MTKPNAHIMVDIETLSTKSNAFVTQIACVAFDDNYEILGDFCRTIDIWKPQEGSHIDGKTVAFWQEQDSGVREKSLGGTVDPEDALADLFSWLCIYKVDTIWANSPSFDLVILNDMFDRLLPTHNNLPPFYKWRDVRTVKAVARDRGVNFDDLKPVHDALDDCNIQILTIKRALSY